MSGKTPEPSTDDATASAEEPTEGQRLDRWLWFTRLVKTRTLAAKFVETGKVRVNAVKVIKPSRTVRPGDVVTATLHRRLHVLKVLSAGERRGPASEAQTLYEDITPQPRGEDEAPEKPATPAKREPGSGRPTKRERRKLDRLRTGR